MNVSPEMIVRSAMTVMVDPHPLIGAYLDALTAAGKASTAVTSGGYLRSFQAWMVRAGVDLGVAIPDNLVRYQVWLATDYRTAHGKRLAITTQATAIAVVKSLYGWLHRRGLVLVNPAARLVPPDPPQRLTVRKDHLRYYHRIKSLLAGGPDGYPVR